MSTELDFIKEMFDSIAPKYDFLNRFLSVGQDIVWRSQMVSGAEISNQSRVLDVACGTCDVSLEIKKQKGNSVTIFATDFSPRMLELGKRKVIKNKEDHSIHLSAGNALALPFKDGSFDAVFIAFGIRNIMDRKGAVTSFFRALRPGGTLAVLELTSPPEGFFRKLYMLYFKRILPTIGTIFSKNSGAYHYLPASVLNFPTPKKFALTLCDSGFQSVKWKCMTFGIVTLFIGKKGYNNVKIR